MSQKKNVPDWHGQGEQVIDGVPYNPYKYEECCDCGLVHRVKYEALGEDDKPIKDAKIRITAWRHKSASVAARKRRKAGDV